MSPEPSDQLEGWADRLEAASAPAPGGVIQRIAIVRETASTQDLAAAMDSGRGGLFLAAGRQTAGRGRFGRTWTQSEGLGVSATLTLDARAHDAELLPIRAGLAACLACEAALPGRTLALRWPNDVVAGDAPLGGRKLAGVLIEHRAGLTLLGIGVNTLQQGAHWPRDLEPKAASLHQLGSNATRLDVLDHLVRALNEALAADDAWVIDQWQQRDALRGQHCALLVAGRRIEGEVLGIDPAAHLRLRLDSGEVRKIDAAAATLLTDQPG